MKSIDPNVSPATRRRPTICSPVTANQLEVLGTARNNRGDLTSVAAHLCVAVASLAAADLLEINVVGFRLTDAGVLLLARIDEHAARPDDAASAEPAGQADLQD